MMGLTEAQQADLLDEDQKIEQGPKQYVWRENWRAVQVFVRCKWDRVLAGDRFVATGIPTAEIEHVADMRLIPRRYRADLLDDVRFLESIAAPILQG